MDQELTTIEWLDAMKLIDPAGHTKRLFDTYVQMDMLTSGPSLTPEVFNFVQQATRETPLLGVTMIEARTKGYISDRTYQAFRNWLFDEMNSIEVDHDG